MYLLMTDETNLQPGERSQFFIYGGLIVPLEELPSLHAKIDSIRSAYDFAAEDALKFSTNSRPEGMDPDRHAAAKDAVIDACRGHGVQFIVDLVLHNLARNRTQEELVTFGVNSVVLTFHRFLREEGETGIVAVDRLPFKKDYKFLQKKFARGIIIEGTQNEWPMSDRIVLFASTCDGASHLSSAVDVVLGGFRYCVNQRQQTDVPRRIMEKVVQMMWHRRDGDVLYMREYGLLLRPKTVRAATYKAQYEALVEHLGNLVQEIPD